MTLKDFTIGQPVYLLEEDGYGRKNIQRTAVVQKVGRTYLTVTYGIHTMKFLPSNHCWVEETEWGYPALLFESKEARADFVERVELNKWFRTTACFPGIYTIEQLRAVKEILEPESSEKE